MTKIFIAILTTFFTHPIHCSDLCLQFKLEIIPDILKQQSFSYLQISEYSNLRILNKNFRKFIDNTSNLSDEQSPFNPYSIMETFFKSQNKPYPLQIKNIKMRSVISSCLKSMMKQNQPVLSVLNTIAVNYLLNENTLITFSHSMTYDQFIDCNGFNFSTIKEVEYENLEAESENLKAYFSSNPTHILALHTNESTMNIAQYQIPLNVNYLALIGDNVAQIGNLILNGHSKLKMLELSFLNNVLSIGDHFLYWCADLTFLDLSSFDNLTTIGDRFLSLCWGLLYLDFSPLNKLTTIGNYFLYGCSCIISLNLRSLNNVKCIGSFFLSQCRGLKTIYLSEDMRNGIVHQALIKSKLQEKIIFA